MTQSHISGVSLSAEHLAQLEYIKEDPIRFAEAFLIEPRSRKPFRANYVQHQILSNPKDIKLVCLSGDAKVLNPKTLVPTPIRSLTRIDSAYTYSFTSARWTWKPVRAFHANGVRPCVRVDFYSGTSITLTQDHRVFTRRGWKEAWELNEGEYVASPTLPAVFGTRALPQHEIASLVRDLYVDPNDPEPIEDEGIFLPDTVYGLTQDSLRDTLHSIWELCGTLDIDTDVARIRCINHTVAEGLRHLFLRFGVRLNIRGHHDGDFINWYVTAEDAIISQRMLSVLGYDVSVPVALHGELSWERVMSIEPAGVRDVYDLEMDCPEHWFLAQDVLVHNCVFRRGGKTVSLLIYILWVCMTQRDMEVVVLAPSDHHVKRLDRELRKWHDANPIIASAVVSRRADRGQWKFTTGSGVQGYTTGAKTGGEALGARGEGGDYVIIDEADWLDDEDWAVADPIIAGDHTRNELRGHPPKAIICSTPKNRDSVFQQRVQNPLKEYGLIRIPITDDPGLTPEEIEETRNKTSPASWEREYLLNLPNMGDNVFREDSVRGMFSHDFYYDIGNRNYGLFCAMGVDWDKHQAGTNIVMLEADPGLGKIEMIYREEIPREQYTLTRALDRIILLNRELAPDAILLDRGFGEFQVEILEKLGMDHPFTGLAHKVRGIQFSEMIECPDPITGLPVKHRFKPFMVTLLGNAMDEHKLQASMYDEEALAQFLGYKVQTITKAGITYSKKNEHIIDATGLALYGIYDVYGDFMSFAPVSVQYMKAPDFSEPPEVREARLQKWAAFDPWKKTVPWAGGSPATGLSRFPSQGTRRTGF